MLTLSCIEISHLFLAFYEVSVQLIDVTIWPLTVLVSIAIFYTPIKELLSRIKSLNTPLGSASMSDAPQSQSSSGLEEDGEELNQIDSTLGDSTFQIEGRDIIETAVFQGYSEETFSKAERIALRESAIGTKPTKEDDPIAFRALEYSALLIVVKSFELIYRDIFGGQLKILRMLKDSGASKKLEVKPFYDSAVQMNASFFASYSFDQYLGWMKIKELITEDNSGVLRITNYGKDLLLFIEYTNSNIEKPN